MLFKLKTSISALYNFGFGKHNIPISGNRIPNFYVEPKEWRKVGVYYASVCPFGKQASYFFKTLGHIFTKYCSAWGWKAQHSHTQRSRQRHLNHQAPCAFRSIQYILDNTVHLWRILVSIYVFFKLQLQFNFHQCHLVS